jgi:hypothetical protein
MSEKSGAAETKLKLVRTITNANTNAKCFFINKTLLIKYIILPKECWLSSEGHSFKTFSDLFVENGNLSLNHHHSTVDYSIMAQSKQAKDAGVIKM